MTQIAKWNGWNSGRGFNHLVRTCPDLAERPVDEVLATAKKGYDPFFVSHGHTPDPSPPAGPAVSGRNRDKR